MCVFVYQYEECNFHGLQVIQDYFITLFYYNFILKVQQALSVYWVCVIFHITYNYTLLVHSRAHILCDEEVC